MHRALQTIILLASTTLAIASTAASEKVVPQNKLNGLTFNGIQVNGTQVNGALLNRKASASATINDKTVQTIKLENGQLAVLTSPTTPINMIPENKMNGITLNGIQVNTLRINGVMLNRQPLATVTLNDKTFQSARLEGGQLMFDVQQH